MGCGRKGIQRKNGGIDGGGLSVCLPLVILPSTIKYRRSFLLAPAHPDGPGKRAVTRLWYHNCFQFSSSPDSISPIKDPDITEWTAQWIAEKVKQIMGTKRLLTVCKLTTGLTISASCDATPGLPLA